MKPGPSKVLPGPCTLAEEAAAAIEMIEKEYSDVAGLILRMAEKIQVMQRALEVISDAADEINQAISEVDYDED